MFISAGSVPQAASASQIWNSKKVHGVKEEECTRSVEGSADRAVAGSK